MLIHGQALARQHRFVHRGDAFNHHAVHRDHGTGPHKHSIAHRHLIKRHLHLRAFRDDHRGFGLKTHQLFNRLGCFALADGFKVFTEHDKRDHDRRRLKIQVLRKLKLTQIDHHRRVYAIDESAPRADGHQRVHIRRAFQQRFKADREETAACGDNRNRQNQLHQREYERKIVRAHEVRNGQFQNREHMRHRDVQHRQRKHSRSNQPYSLVFERLRTPLAFRVVHGLRLNIDGRIARFDNRLFDGKKFHRRGVVFDHGPVGCEVHRCRLDTRQFFERPLHRCRTGSAGHALYRQLKLFNGLLVNKAVARIFHRFFKLLKPELAVIIFHAQLFRRDIHVAEFHAVEFGDGFLRMRGA